MVHVYRKVYALEHERPFTGFSHFLLCPCLVTFLSDRPFSIIGLDIAFVCLVKQYTFFMSQSVLSSMIFTCCACACTSTINELQHISTCSLCLWRLCEVADNLPALTACRVPKESVELALGDIRPLSHSRGLRLLTLCRIRCTCTCITTCS